MPTIRRAAKLANGSLPPTYSVSTGNVFFEGLARNPPVNGVNEKYLEEIGITSGTTTSLLGGLRWSGIIDSEDMLIDPDLPARLGNPKTREQAFFEILKKTYPEELLDQRWLQSSTLESITRYFEGKNVKETSSGRAARIFMWMAQQAGLELGEEIPTPMPRPSILLRGNSNKSDWSKDEDVDNKDRGNKSPQEQYLEILLNNLRTSKTLPDKDLQEHIERLLAEIKEQRSNEE